jgi:hypothetical protein
MHSKLCTSTALLTALAYKRTSHVSYVGMEKFTAEDTAAPHEIT